MNQDLLSRVSRPYILKAKEEDLEGLNEFDSNMKIIYIEGLHCSTVEEMFKEFANKCSFPDYFGHNWMALHECLSDIPDWIKANGYIIVVLNGTEFLSQDKKFMTSFEDTIRQVGNILSEPTPEEQKNEEWSREAKPFHVLFVY